MDQEHEAEKSDRNNIWGEFCQQTSRSQLSWVRDPTNVHLDNDLQVRGIY